MILIFAAIPAWAYVSWWMHVNCPPGRWDVCSELGSVAWPTPPSLFAAELVEYVGPLLGLALLSFDFVQWKRSAPRKPERPSIS
jgi:hypothetical protein